MGKFEAYLLTAFFSYFAGIDSGLYLDHNKKEKSDQCSPASVSYQDLNDDHKPDLIVKIQGLAEPRIFLQQEAGFFQPLETVLHYSQQKTPPEFYRGKPFNSLEEKIRARARLL